MITLLLFTSCRGSELVCDSHPYCRGGGHINISYLFTSSTGTHTHAETDDVAIATNMTHWSIFARKGTTTPEEKEKNKNHTMPEHVHQHY